MGYKVFLCKAVLKADIVQKTHTAITWSWIMKVSSGCLENFAHESWVTQSPCTKILALQKQEQNFDNAWQFLCDAVTKGNHISCPAQIHSYYEICGKKTKADIHEQSAWCSVLSRESHPWWIRSRSMNKSKIIRKICFYSSCTWKLKLIKHTKISRCETFIREFWVNSSSNCFLFGEKRKTSKVTTKSDLRFSKILCYATVVEENSWKLYVTNVNNKFHGVVSIPYTTREFRSACKY